tara:strand:- start:879 stop:1298 length:420 start_codon:yes stop_codon:yes gene_type:complete
MKITPEIRDTILAFTGIIVSLSTGIWTFYNYNESERENEVNAIFAISNLIQEIEIESKLKDEDLPKIQALTRKLSVSLPHRYNQISSPFCEEERWKNQWVSLKSNLDKVYAQGFDQVKDEVKSNWSSIIQMKDLKMLGE